MALGKFQQTALTFGSSPTLLQGGWRMGVAATAGIFAAGSMGTILGIGNLTAFTENLEKTTTQAGNSNMPEPMIAGQTCTVAFEMMEFWPTAFAAIRGGSSDTLNAPTAGTYLTGTANVFSTGGLQNLGVKAFKFENTTRVNGATAVTVLVVYRARVEAGMAWTPKGDHDTDPLMVIPFTVTGELDTARTPGDQLYIMESELGV
jgi:hypothetical protein